MEWPLTRLVLLGTSSLVSYRGVAKITRTRPASSHTPRSKQKRTDKNVCPIGDVLGWTLPYLTSQPETAAFYAAPMARRCWKHSRQKTGRPCVGRKGTVVSFPHCEQFVFVSARIGDACPPPPPPPSARFALQLLQRFGSFLKPLSAKNICSPAVKTNSAPHSAHFRTLSWYSIDGSLAPGPAWKAHTTRTMLDGEGEPIDREGRARVPRSCEREAATETQQPKCDRRAVNLRLMGA